MRHHKFTRSIVSFVLLVFSSAGAANSPFFFPQRNPVLNLEKIRSDLSFSLFRGGANETSVRIAIFDKDWAGVERRLGDTLPRTTRVHFTATESTLRRGHGTAMAEIVSALLSSSQIPFELHLYDVAGYSKLKAASREVIANKVDVVLYSEIWDYGNNFDGRGIINDLVTRVAKAGILWINAAGNLGRTTYNTPIRVDSDSWVALPDENQALKFYCRSSSCDMRLVASWNDYNGRESGGTEKNLDLAVFDDMMNLIAKSELKQTMEPEGQPGSSGFPREIISARLKAGTYYIKLKDRSNNFDSTRDTLRLSASGEGVQFHRYDPYESLSNPADNPLAITVGARDSEKSSISWRFQKPELATNSSVYMEEGEFRGSSNSAAMVAAVAAAWVWSSGRSNGVSRRAAFLRFARGY